MKLPSFDLGEYRDLLSALRDAGWALQPVTAMTDLAAGTAHVRHDVDFHLARIDAMARIEAELGVQATYYVLLTGPYNVLAIDNRRRLAELVELGHEIGLHYDLTTYPRGPSSSSHLDWECSVLERLAGAPVRTICMHEPTPDGDVFRDGTRFVHPHDRAWADGLLYVSDSARGWRDEALLGCLDDRRPRRLLLNTHPELWLDGTITDRMRYLDDVVLPNVTDPGRAYIEDVVRNGWRHHPGAQLHDEREAVSAADTEPRRREG